MGASQDGPRNLVKMPSQDFRVTKLLSTAEMKWIVVSGKLVGHFGVVTLRTRLDRTHFLLQLENIGSSLAYLAGVGVALDGLTAKDIKDGNLKAILSLFFALSRYKQQQKQAQQERKELEKLREKKQESEMVTTAASK
nr:neuron navigator 3-like [Procambarus clarkii]